LLQRAKKGMPVNCSKCGCCFEVLIITPTLREEEATDQLNFQIAGGLSI
jgi:hypothetical protein